MIFIMTVNTKVLAFNFLQASEGGYALFTPEDVLIYFNDSYEDLYCFKNQAAIGLASTCRHRHGNICHLKQGLYSNFDRKARDIAYVIHFMA